MLLGYMGSGKSTLGKKLARELGLPFYDLDAKIAEEEGRTVATICEMERESYFREKERAKLLQLLAEDSGFVLSVGGGTPCYFNNMEVMNTAGITVFIQMPPAALADRLKNAKEKRPLLNGLAPEDMESFIANHLEQRLPYYSQAKFVVSGLSAKPQDILLLLGKSEL